MVHAENYIYMCSDPGQKIVIKAIREKKLNGIVMSNCSPSLHERTFRNLVASEGINPYLCEIANIREQCSWPHASDKEAATAKAVTIIQTIVEKLSQNLSLIPTVVPVTKKVLVIGAGIAGMQSALDIADGGYGVVLVEKSPGIGGHAAQLSETFPKLENVNSMIMPFVERVLSHPNIKLYRYSEVESVSGYVGNFQVSIRQKATYLDPAKCDNCGLCLQNCPVKIPSDFERGLVERRAIYLPRVQNSDCKPLIDNQACRHFTNVDCETCQQICPRGAIDFEQRNIITQEKVGAIVVATGYDLYPRTVLGEYETDPDVIDGLQFERLLSSAGPTGGEIKRPSDKKVPRQLVFISCVGSRDPEHGVPYCSRVCCIYTAKQAMLYKKAITDGQAYVFYMDVRSDAKYYEEFTKKAVDEGGVLYLRGRVSRVFRDGDVLKVWGSDTLTGKSIEISADMVVLATAMVSSPGARDLARKLNIISDANGFMSEAHLKLRPVETLTSGIYLAGTAQWPRDIPETIASASGAASKILSLFSRKELLHEPTVAEVDIEVCKGCGQCVSICAYEAVDLDPRKKIARVNEALCEGCGACAATCPSKAMKHRNWTPRQFFEMLDVVTSGEVKK